jgi:hypothetical protein
MAGGLALGVAAFTAMDESWIHTAPEFGMAEAYDEHIQQACAGKIAPDVLIIGDSRAVAGISVQEMRAAGIEAEKFALGGSGIFVGWATLDRLIDCGVRPKTVVMAYGTVHMIESGALLDRMTNYDLLKGSRASQAYAKAAQWEDRLERQLAFKAVSLLGTEATGLDFVLMRPALRNILAMPARALENRHLNEQERKSFAASGGDRYYGLFSKIDELPTEAQFEGEWAAVINWSAAHAIGDMGKANGFDVKFYILPVSELARRDMPPRIFEMVDTFRRTLHEFGIVALNDVWALPDSDFGDPSHVNPSGRAKVMADFMARLSADAPLAGAQRSGAQRDDAVTLAGQEVEKSGQ